MLIRQFAYFTQNKAVIYYGALWVNYTYPIIAYWHFHHNIARCSISSELARPNGFVDRENANNFGAK
jgi:hypothetical protein